MTDQVAGFVEPHLRLSNPQKGLQQNYFIANHGGEGKVFLALSVTSCMLFHLVISSSLPFNLLLLAHYPSTKLGT